MARLHLTLIGAWSKPYSGAMDPLVVEALALRWCHLCAPAWLPKGGDGDGLPRGRSSLEFSL